MTTQAAPTAIFAGRWQRILAIYPSSLLQGLTVTLYPAAGPLLTDPAQHGLSEAQFGSLFAPQIIAAIVASALASRIARQFSMKTLLMCGLLANLIAMMLLVTTVMFIDNSGITIALLLLGATGVGAGFGFTITALNSFAFDLFTGNEDSAVTALHVMTGTGQMSVSLILSAFIGAGFWWGAPATIGLIIAAMLAYQWRLPLKIQAEAASSPSESNRLPVRAWLWAAIGLLYGTMAGTFGNWAPIYLEDAAGLSMGTAALGLTMFWGAVAVGRVIFSVLAVRFDVRLLHILSPVLVGIIFVMLPFLMGSAANLGALFAAGLLLSFFFPYSISLASAEFPAFTAAISGMLVAGLQLGSGASAIVVGLATGSGIPLPTIFQLSTLYAVITVLIAVYLRWSSVKTPQSAVSGLHQDLPCVPVPCPQIKMKERAA